MDRKDRRAKGTLCSFWWGIIGIGTRGKVPRVGQTVAKPERVGPPYPDIVSLRMRSNFHGHQKGGNSTFWCLRYIFVKLHSKNIFDRGFLGQFGTFFGIFGSRIDPSESAILISNSIFIFGDYGNFTVPPPPPLPSDQNVMATKCDKSSDEHWGQWTNKSHPMMMMMMISTSPSPSSSSSFVLRLSLE